MLNTYSVMPCQNVREDPISSVCFLLLSVVSSSTLGAKQLGTMLSLENSVGAQCFRMLELTSQTFRANLQSLVLCSISVCNHLYCLQLALTFQQGLGTSSIRVYVVMLSQNFRPLYIESSRKEYFSNGLLLLQNGSFFDEGWELNSLWA